MTMDSILGGYGEDTTALWDQEQQDLKNNPVYGPQPPAGLPGPQQGQSLQGIASGLLGGASNAVSGIASALTPNYIEQAATNQQQQYGSGPAGWMNYYNQDIPGVSPFIRENVQPVAGDIGAAIASGPNLFGFGMPNPGAQDIGRFAGENIVPVSAGDFALNAAFAGGPFEAVTGLPLDDLARGAFRTGAEAFRAGMPEPSMFPGLGAGVPPPQDFTPANFSIDDLARQGPSPIDFQQAQMGPAGRIESQAELDSRALQSQMADQFPQPSGANPALPNPIDTVSQSAPLTDRELMQQAMDTARGGGPTPAPMVETSPVSPPPASLTPQEIADAMWQADRNAGLPADAVPPSQQFPQLSERTTTTPTSGEVSGTGFTMRPQTSDDLIQTASNALGRETTPHEQEWIGNRVNMASGGQQPPTPPTLQRPDLAPIPPDASGYKTSLLDWINAPRSLMTGLDRSYQLRQSIGLVGHLKEMKDSFLAGNRAMLSEQEAQHIYDGIVNSGYKDLKKELYISPLNGVSDTLKREEQYAGMGAVEKIPVVGAVYRPFERGNVVQINKLRSDVADTFLDKYLDRLHPEEGVRFNQTGQVSPNAQKEIDDYMRYVNRQSGRGTLGPLEDSKVTNALSNIFFSARNMVAKPEAAATLLNQPFTPVWNEAVKDYAALLGLGGMTLGLAYAGGAQAGLDWRSPDFGKIVSGGQHVDIWGGNVQMVRAIAQMIEGAAGRNNRITAAGKEFSVPVPQVAAEFVRNKFAPQFALGGQGIRMLLGDRVSPEVQSALETAFPKRNAPGADVSTGVNYATSLFLQDVVQAYQSDGLAGALKAAPTFLGVGVQTYGDNSQAYALSQMRDSALGGSAKYSDLLPKEQAALNSALQSKDPTAYAQALAQSKENLDPAILTNQQARDQLKADKATQTAPIVQGVRDGLYDPQAAYRAIRAIDQANSLQVAELFRDPKYIEATKDFTNNDSPARQALDAYYSIPNNSKGFDGKVDWGKVESTRAELIDTLVKAGQSDLARRILRETESPNLLDDLKKLAPAHR